MTIFPSSSPSVAAEMNQKGNKLATRSISGLVLSTGGTLGASPPAK
jgi:hypothetical protein